MRPPIDPMFTSGNGLRIVSPLFMAVASTITSPFSTQWLWLRGTPLGWLSVPEVQQMVKTSPAETGFSAR